MRVFIAGTSTRPVTAEFGIIYLLESYYYIMARKAKWIMENYQKGLYKGFLLDSGAYSFLSGTCTVDFTKYLYGYIDFINRFDIKHFVELDLDSIVGLSKVEEYRNILERETGKRCIPAWHESRGLQYYKDMAQEWKYIAIGGLAQLRFKKSDYRQLRALVDIAHSYGAEVHGLGMTDTNWLPQIGWDSVDSASWIYGSVCGNIELFDGKRIVHIKKPEGSRKKYHSSYFDAINLTSWVKYQKYMDGATE